MTDRLKNFIETHIDLIEQQLWEQLYEDSEKLDEYEVGELTELLLNIDIHPEDVLTDIPYAFLYGSKIKEFTIPSHITAIGDRAFAECENLDKIIIPDNVKEMGMYAFAHCTNLSEVGIGKGLASIPEYAFKQCAVKSIVIPDNISEIVKYAFESCSELENVTLPNNINLDSYAFADTGIKKIKFKSPTSLGDYVFYETLLNSIEFEGTIEDAYNDGLEWGMHTFSYTDATHISCIDGEIEI